MNTVPIALAVLLVTTFNVTTAHAQAPLTRADVIAQYEEAARTGDLMAPGDSGMKLNERYPDRYPKAAPTAGMTRAQVVADLQAAIRSGDVVASGDRGMKENERFPQRYPAPPFVAGKTHHQVRTETLEAVRAGEILATGDSGLKLNEQFPRRYANAVARHAADHQGMAAVTPAVPADGAVQ